MKLIYICDVQLYRVQLVVSDFYFFNSFIEVNDFYFLRLFPSHKWSKLEGLHYA